MCDKQTDIDRKATDRFLIRLMLGSQYNKVLNATDEKAIFLACLRSAWGDAFRHVSKNKWKNDKEKAEIVRSLPIDYKGSVDARLDEYICKLLEDNVYDVFIRFVEETTTKEKAILLNAKTNFLSDAFSKIKEPLHFGHFQKLFNMAVKSYVCVYQHAEELNINKDIFEHIKHTKHADCPIDNVILKKLDEKTKLPPDYKKEDDKIKRFADIKWSNKEFTTECYETVQNKIKKLLEVKYGKDQKSNLYFDFENWN